MRPDKKPAIQTGLAGAQRVLRRGMRGEDVRYLQERLRYLRAYAGAIDGVFGPLTEAGVRAVQHTARIAVDGIVGPDTRFALDILIPGEVRPAPKPDPVIVPTPGDPVLTVPSPSEPVREETTGRANIQMKQLALFALGAAISTVTLTAITRRQERTKTRRAHA